jgi:hypothetical protein
MGIRFGNAVSCRTGIHQECSTVRQNEERRVSSTGRDLVNVQRPGRPSRKKSPNLDFVLRTHDAHSSNTKEPDNGPESGYWTYGLHRRWHPYFNTSRSGSQTLRRIRLQLPVATEGWSSGGLSMPVVGKGWAANGGRESGGGLTAGFRIYQGLSGGRLTATKCADDPHRLARLVKDQPPTWTKHRWPTSLSFVESSAVSSGESGLCSDPGRLHRTAE